MDLREKKTKRNISNAFLQLRKQKPLERITVKELSELAEISKATFYLHYRDIFDLNDVLQEEVIQNILKGLSHPEYFLQDKRAFTSELINGFHAQQSMIDILFSGNQAAVLPMWIEKELRKFVHSIVPNADPRLDMLLTYQIQGSFFVYQEYHKQLSHEAVVRFIEDLSGATASCYT